MAGVQEGWKEIGKRRGPGIPAPSGQYRVGCVDLMHQLEGDDRGLLIRLHYPTEATPEAGYTYSSCFPHPRYIQGFLEVEKAVITKPITKIVCKFQLIAGHCIIFITFPSSSNASIRISTITCSGIQERYGVDNF